MGMLLRQWFRACDVCWGEASVGRAIADNTHLKSLGFDTGGKRTPLSEREPQKLTNYKHFVSAVARNRSIKHFFPDAKYGDVIFPMLAPFFENNSSLRSFEIGSEEHFFGHDMNSEAVTAMANAVSKSKTISRFIFI